MGFTKEQLAVFEGRTVDDLVGPDVKLLFVGINPGLWTAATNTHFCHPSNRFYPALRAAGLMGWTFDASNGMTPKERDRFARSGIGITNLVPRATARASQLMSSELRQGALRLERRVGELLPRVVAFAGITAFRIAFQRPGALMGRQPETMAGAGVWVVPNPSGLNAHETIDSLASWYRLVADEAGL